MHEIGIVDDIVAAIKAKLNKTGKDKKVKRVIIVIGELEHVTPEHFEFHFRDRTKGTLLEGAKLSFKKAKASFRCKDCKNDFSGEEGLLGCPSCKGKLNDVISGNGVYVESVEIG